MNTPNPSEDPRVIAVRENKLVGRGSCSKIDECVTDAELVESLDDTSWGEDPITTTAGAIEWAIEVEDLHLEAALNARKGNDDDPQLLAYREWHERVKAWRGEG